jgi:soluble lytic murein transglycosylase-like protein
VQLSKVAILLGISLVSAGSALAQDKGAAPVSDSKPVAAETSVSAAKAEPLSQPADNYKNSLNSLSGLYQNEVQKLEKQNEQLKGLFKDGLVAKVDLDASDKLLADAKAKVENVARQIADANKPAPVVTVADSSVLTAGNQAWSTGNTRVDGLIRFYANQNSIDPYLVFCLMNQESRFTSGATSSKGAMGLMQLMPGTAARYGVTNPYDMGQSIMGGTRYLKDLLKMFNGRVDLALAGYNAGENAVIKYGYTIPPYDETRNYVKLIIKRYGKVTTSEQKSKS